MCNAGVLSGCVIVIVVVIVTKRLVPAAWKILSLRLTVGRCFRPLPDKLRWRWSFGRLGCKEYSKGGSDVSIKREDLEDGL